MSILTSIWPSAGYIMLGFLFVLSLVIFFHELGHFMIGRWCGVKVDTFSLGFGPELFGFNDRYGTHWRVAAFPLGGYVKFHGDANSASGGRTTRGVVKRLSEAGFSRIVRLAASTRQPSAAARHATSRPMWPSPTMPTV